MYPPSNENEMLSGLQYSGENTLIYIHIPFCASRCLYCYWAIDLNHSSEYMDRYLDALEREIDLRLKILDNITISPKAILLGGGTPTLLTPDQIKRLLEILSTKFDLGQCMQYCTEAEPTNLLGTQGADRLRIMKEYGINRISLGVQSFNDTVLKTINRPHSKKDALQAIEQVKASGIGSVAIDLIYGLPDQTLESWIETLNVSHTCGIGGHQLYRLRITPHGDKIGPVKKLFEDDFSRFPSGDQVYIMKQLGIMLSMQNNFEETTRRVFCKDSSQGSYYNYFYARLYNVLGFGLSAWSNFQDRFYLNSGSNLDEYYSYLEKGKLPINRGIIRSGMDEKIWALTLPLKCDAFNKQAYKNKIGSSVDEDFRIKIDRLKKYDLLQEDDKMIKYTEKGRFFADEVCIYFYDEKYVPFPDKMYSQGMLNPYL